MLNDTTSLNTVIAGDNDGIELVEAIQDNDSYNSFEAFENSTITEIIRNAVEQLPDELRNIIYLRYYKKLSVKTTSKKLDLTQNEARSKERAALNLLHKNTAIQNLAREHIRFGLF